MGGKLRRAILVIFLVAALSLLVGFGFVAQFSPMNVNESGSWTQRGALMDRFEAEERIRGKLTPSAASPHCPYYPPDVNDIPFIFSRTTILQFRERVKRYPKNRPILLLVVNEGGLPLLANWLCVSAQHVATESLLVVVPPENGTQFESTLTRKGITAIQTSFR